MGSAERRRRRVYLAADRRIGARYSRLPLRRLYLERTISSYQIERPRLAYLSKRKSSGAAAGVYVNCVRAPSRPTFWADGASLACCNRLSNLLLFGRSNAQAGCTHRRAPPVYNGISRPAIVAHTMINRLRCSHQF